MATIIENERSWGIQIISRLNQYLNEKSFWIRRSGGESGLKCGGKTLFPDVYLFGGDDLDCILQGWELKLPDTAIEDGELIENASIKADKLGLNSFLLWNFSHAVLYIKTNGHFLPEKTWDNLGHVRTRSEALEIISTTPHLWEEMLIDIVEDLNRYFISGDLKGKALVDAIDLNVIVDSVSNFSSGFQEYLKREAIANAVLDSEIELWWHENKLAYQEKTEDKKWEILTKIVINNWINKIIYAHILKKHYHEAGAIEGLSEVDSISEAIGIFEGISLSCDFWNIFKNYSIETDHVNVDLHIPLEILNAFKEFNSFLNDFEIENLSPELTEKLLINTILQNKRKLAGQFSTPDKLARFLARSVIDDKRKVVYDGCCGTGTIVKEAYRYKTEGLTDEIAIKSIYASDKFSFPIQISNINLSNPKNRGRLLRLFKRDIFDVQIGSAFNLYDPSNGEEIEEIVPAMDIILSNLPFIQQEDFQKFNPAAKEKINQQVRTDLGNAYKVNGKSDIYAYILIHLHSLLKDGGKAGVIISNSWLSTDWGLDLRNILLSYFSIEKIITSGNGKWFSNADVVTNILVLKKRDRIGVLDENEKTSFITIKNDLINLPEDQVDGLSRLTLLNRENPGLISINTLTLKEIENFKQFNIGWNAFFAKVKFLEEVTENLVDIGTYFDVQRGEKTGCDDLFYPPENSGIEEEFIQKTVKTTKGSRGYDICANDATFVCPASIQELQTNGKSGTLNWIRRYEHRKSSITKKKGREWYDLPRNIKVDFVINVNPDKSIVFYAMDEQVYVGQRGVGLRMKTATDKKLLHALLNSLLSIFLVEATGFGRGLGVLDLNSTKIQGMKMLNPDILSPEQQSKIIEKFEILKTRNVMSIDQEVDAPDRMDFDKYVLECYGLESVYDAIKKALVDLYTARASVRT